MIAAAKSPIGFAGYFRLFDGDGNDLDVGFRHEQPEIPFAQTLRDLLDDWRARVARER